MARVRQGEDGVALLATLVVAMLLTTAGAGLVLLTMSESLITVNYRATREAFYAADAGLARAIADLRCMPDWSAALAPPPGNARSGFFDGAANPAAADGTPIGITSRGAELQRRTDASYAGPPGDRPAWRLFAQGDLARAVPGGARALPYVVVWVADDEADGDGSNGRDGNGVVRLHAESFGVGRSRGALDATVVRTPSGVRVMSWQRVN